MKVTFWITGIIAFCVSTTAQAWDLNFGEANSFNLFVKKTATLNVSDSESRVAANTLISSGYDIGACLHNEYASASWSNCDFASQGIGQSVYAEQFLAQNSANTYTGIAQVSGSFFTDSFQHLTTLSDNLSKLADDVSLNNQWGDLVVSDTSSLVDERGFFVTSTTLSELKSAWRLNAMNLQDGQTLVVNVDAKGKSKINGLNLVGAGANQIIYNFYNAENLTFEWGNIEGSILAANANFTHKQGLITGRLIAESYTTNPHGGTQLNYVGDFTPVGVPDSTPPTDVSAPYVLAIVALSVSLLLMRRRWQRASYMPIV